MLTNPSRNQKIWYISIKLLYGVPTFGSIIVRQQNHKKLEQIIPLSVYVYQVLHFYLYFCVTVPFCTTLQQTASMVLFVSFSLCFCLLMSLRHSITRTLHLHISQSGLRSTSLPICLSYHPSLQHSMSLCIFVALELSMTLSLRFSADLSLCPSSPCRSST